MTLQRKILWAGMLVYTVSLFLVAVGGGGLYAGARGYDCAVNAVLMPFHLSGFGISALESTSLFVSGLINLVFLATVISDAGQAVSPARTHRKSCTSLDGSFLLGRFSL
jgi:hypothetical protein